MKRTVTCGELTKTQIGRNITLNGWVHRLRDHGGIHFIDLRDRYGLTQVVIDQDASQNLHNIIKDLRMEFCIAVNGIVRERPPDMVNKDMLTGAVEVSAKNITILSKCEVLPFIIDEKSDAKEDLRLKYRYLDLRTFSMQRKIRLRTDATFAIREYLTEQGFMEIETPNLIKSTPEGARDFLVPSRIHPGKFYALPQSPQMFKQILMVSGFDRYFQIAHCFRDEDARGDRQLEHTQIDMEMSFVSKEDVFQVIEGMLKHTFSKILGVSLSTPFQRMSYEEAMNRYGSDKPDLRYDLEIIDFNTMAEKSDFNTFKKIVSAHGTIKALVAPGCASFSRKQILELEDRAKIYGAQGLAWMKVAESGLDGGVAKFFTPLEAEVISTLNAKPGDLILMVGDKWKTACTAMGAVRTKLGKDVFTPDPLSFAFCWIIDFPLFEWDEDETRWEAAHHMFTMPQEQFLDTMEQDPGKVKGDLYDLVGNGFELASGSIRIHEPAIQQRIFNILGFSKEEADSRFGFLLKAFQYGPPPHGGIAPGLDRLIMIMCGETSIKEIIPFPKNNVGISPMDDSPSLVEEKQLKELNIELTMEAKKALQKKAQNNK